jgi:hypothetical protein
MNTLTSNQTSPNSTNPRSDKLDSLSMKTTRPERPNYLLNPIAVMFTLATIGSLAVAFAGERRAAAPTFTGDAFRGTFFQSTDEAIRGQRPLLGQVIEPAPRATAATASAKPTTSGDADSGKQSSFTSLISPASLEDEIKRVRLMFDSAVTTPGAFKSGEFQNARLHLTTLASLFAVIVEHQGEVRWKKDAAAARDLFARSAANCKSGSPQVYNETKLRKNDLEDIVSGGGLSARQAESENDWSMIADRVPLMIYAESLLEGPLKSGSRNAETVKTEGDSLRRSAELMAVIGQILKTDGMVDADDEDYKLLSAQFIEASRSVSLALDQGDAAAVGRAVGAISQSCAKCHESYR